MFRITITKLIVHDWEGQKWGVWHHKRHFSISGENLQFLFTSSTGIVHVKISNFFFISTSIPALEFDQNNMELSLLVCDKVLYQLVDDEASL